MEAQYNATTPKEVAQAQNHLSGSQRNELERLFSNYSKLFTRELGLYNFSKYT